MGGCGNLKGRRDDGVGSGEVRCSFVAVVRYGITSLLCPSSDHLAPLVPYATIRLVSYQYPDPPDASDLLPSHLTRSPPPRPAATSAPPPGPVASTPTPAPGPPAPPPAGSASPRPGRTPCPGNDGACAPSAQRRLAAHPAIPVVQRRSLHSTPSAM